MTARRLVWAASVTGATLLAALIVLDVALRFVPRYHRLDAANDSSVPYVIRVHSNQYPALAYGYALPPQFDGTREPSQEIGRLIDDPATYELLTTDCVVVESWTAAAGGSIWVGVDGDRAFRAGPLTAGGDTSELERTDDCVS